MYTDAELVASIQTNNETLRAYEGTFIPFGEKLTFDNETRVLFKANTKGEAIKIAREYGRRIMNQKMVYLYRHW